MVEPRSLRVDPRLNFADEGWLGVPVKVPRRLGQTELTGGAGRRHRWTSFPTGQDLPSSRPTGSDQRSAPGRRFGSTSWVPPPQPAHRVQGRTRPFCRIKAADRDVGREVDNNEVAVRPACTLRQQRPAPPHRNRASRSECALGQVVQNGQRYGLARGARMPSPHALWIVNAAREGQTLRVRGAQGPLRGTWASTTGQSFSRCGSGPNRVDPGACRG